MPSPTCTVNATSTASGVNVSAASTPTIQLADLTGVSTWSITCVGRDEVASAPTLNVNQGAKSATFTAGAAGSAYVFESKINGGVDANGTAAPSYTTRFAVFVLTSRGKRVLAYELTNEANATVGWVAEANSAIRLADTAPTYDAFANLPAAGVSGRTFYASDSPTFQWVDDGSNMRPVLGPTAGYRPPLAATFTGANQGAATLDDSNGALVVTGVDDGATTTLRGFEYTLPGSTAFFEATFEGIADSYTGAGQYSETGIFMRETSSGKSATFVIIHDDGVPVAFARDIFTSYTVRTVNTALSPSVYGHGPIIMRMSLLSGNMSYRISRDRRTWVTLLSEAVTVPFTTEPNRGGIITMGVSAKPRALIRHALAGVS